MRTKLPHIHVIIQRQKDMRFRETDGQALTEAILLLGCRVNVIFVLQSLVNR